MRIFTRLSAEYFFAIFLWKPIDFYLQDSILQLINANPLLQAYAGFGVLSSIAAYKTIVGGGVPDAPATAFVYRSTHHFSYPSSSVS